MPSILVVEDDPAVHTTFCSMLRTLGFTAFQADTVDDAKKLLELETIDAITLDVTLPDSSGSRQSGLTLLEYLRATPAYAKLPVLIFTGTFLSHEDEMFAKKHGAEVHYKPQPYYELAAHLNRLVG